MPEESKVIGMEKAGCWMMGLKKLLFSCSEQQAKTSLG